MASKGNENFVAIPGPRLLEAIGTVAVKWSALEFEIDNLLYWASDPADEEGIKSFLKTKGFQQRCDRLKTILRSEHLAKSGTLRLVSIIDGALSLKGERDQIIHGLYGDPASSKTNADAILTTLKGHKIHTEWPITRLRVVKTAKAIDQICLNISNHLLEHSTDVGGGFFMAITWHHKDRREN
ncbi:hypothetical protein SRABI05_00083 [Agrobacterium fabrum]|uniref:hypothetical protein n=1 Tax=Agrobacterium fabrum TaxID=1176649 RepID=UPI001DC88FC9|nr:hypothetical protein [Agrobacterium fabrum]CAH0132556.1 hypothetical protein SRABI05_00083 [Agrobacterium fabrum]CAH0152016.1 hypothetical protein SRABI46_00798 [Agrobacterium fabrum]